MKANEGKSKEIFKKLPSYGYSEVASQAIWRWYNSSSDKNFKSETKNSSE